MAFFQLKTNISLELEREAMSLTLIQGLGLANIYKKVLVYEKLSACGDALLTSDIQFFLIIFLLVK